MVTQISILQCAVYRSQQEGCEKLGNMYPSLSISTMSNLGQWTYAAYRDGLIVNMEIWYMEKTAFIVRRGPCSVSSSTVGPVIDQPQLPAQISGEIESFRVAGAACRSNWSCITWNRNWHYPYIVHVVCMWMWTQWNGNFQYQFKLCCIFVNR